MVKNLPAELKTLNQWVLWKLLPGKDGAKPRKVPFQINGKPASTTDSKTWTTFDEVIKVADKFNGIGFVFSPNDPYTGIDLDGAIGPDGLTETAQEILTRLDSYAEISPSGKGLHVLIRGKLKDGAAYKHNGVEVYDRGRFFCMTGKRHDYTVEKIEDRNEQVNLWVQELRAAKEAAQKEARSSSGDQSAKSAPSVLDRAQKYFSKLAPAIDGQKGHDQTYHAAAIAVHGFALNESEAYEVLSSWNTRCSPPWSERDLRRKISQAATKAQSDKPRGWLRDTPNPNGFRYAEAFEKSQNSQKRAYTIIRPSRLLKYDTENDPNALFANRWQCRGGSCVWNGATGIGKSSEGVQAAILWAIGLDFFGLKPVSALKSIFIQAENDEGDLAEMFQGVVNGLSLTDRMAEIESNVGFISDSGVTGDDFINLLRTIAQNERPDLVWIDPLFSFFGGNISDQKEVSKFLRPGLNPIAQEYGLAIQILHHTNKPRLDVPIAKPKGSDSSYSGSGSAELANWARATMLLREIDENSFELRAGKRGKRSGLIDIDGKPTNHVLIKHSTTGICWERSTEATDNEKESVKESGFEVISKLKTGHKYTKTEIREIVQKVIGRGRTQVTTIGTIYNKIWLFVLNELSNPQIPGYYVNKSGNPVTSGFSPADAENTQKSGRPVSPKGDPDNRISVNEIELLQLQALFDNDWKSKQTIIDLLKPTFKNRTRQIFEVFHSRHELHEVDKEAGEVKKPGFIVRMQSGSLMFKATKE